MVTMNWQTDTHVRRSVLPPARTFVVTDK